MNEGEKKDLEQKAEEYSKKAEQESDHMMKIENLKKATSLLFIRKQ